MEDIKVCRICLLMDVKLLNFCSYPLETYYDILVGNTTSVQELPKYTCYECSAQLNKFYLFREKCLRGQKVLLGVRHSCVKVTGDVIKQLDRNIFQLSSEIGFSEVLYINIEPQTTREVDNDEIKIEPIEIVDDGDQNNEKEVKRAGSDNYSVFSNNDRLLYRDDDEPLSKDNDEIKMEPIEIVDNEDQNNEKEVKRADSNNHAVFSHNDRLLYRDDDEPLSKDNDEIEMEPIEIVDNEDQNNEKEVKREDSNNHAVFSHNDRLLYRDDDEPLSKDNDEIKIEPIEIVDNEDQNNEKEVKREDSNNHAVFSHNDRLLYRDDDEPLSKDNDEIKIEPIEIVDNEDQNNEKEVKREDSNNHSVFSDNDRLLYRDDDEPLSKCKENKKEKRDQNSEKEVMREDSDNHSVFSHNDRLLYRDDDEPLSKYKENKKEKRDQNNEKEVMREDSDNHSVFSHNDRLLYRDDDEPLSKYKENKKEKRDQNNEKEVMREDSDNHSVFSHNDRLLYRDDDEPLSKYKENKKEKRDQNNEKEVMREDSDNYSVFSNNDRLLYSDDDEPLSKYKENKKEKRDQNNEKGVDIEDRDNHSVFSNNDRLLYSDDDEPLSKYKEKKKEKRGRKRKKSDVEKITNVNIKVKSDLALADSATVTQETIADVKPKRGRPRKNDGKNKAKKKVKPRRTNNTGGDSDEDNDIESYCTIVTLTEEEQKEEIRQRQKSSNYLNAIYQCKLCFKGFINAQAWEHHVSKHEPSSGDIECQICKYRYKTKTQLKNHASNHEKKYACKCCSYVTINTTQAKLHQRWHKGVTYKCQDCDEILTKWSSYLNHVRSKHSTHFVCGACGDSFVSRHGLTMHRTQIHKDLVEKEKTEGEAEDIPYCALCDVKFVSTEAYKRHLVTSSKHTQSNDFNLGCRACGEQFSDPEALRLHHRREHARPRPRNNGKDPRLAWPAPCEHCSEVIPNGREYWNHFRRVHPDKNYPSPKNFICDICGKGFRNNTFLVYHKRTHFEERAFKCQKCPKAFFNRANLQQHEIVHSEHRPHACSMCSKTYKYKNALDNHVRSHTGVKPYACEVCGKAFAKSTNRKLHVFTVHLKQPSPYSRRARLERRARSRGKDQPVHFLY